jgi:hypothetical protein
MTSRLQCSSRGWLDQAHRHRTLIKFITVCVARYCLLVRFSYCTGDTSLAGHAQPVTIGRVK